MSLPLLGAACFLNAFAAITVAGDGEPSMPIGLDAAVRRALNETGFEAVWQVGTPFDGVDAAWQAPNRQQDLRTYFLDGGVRVTPRVAGRDWSFAMRFAGLERGDIAAPAGAAELVLDGARVEYRRGDVTEWYVNDARGVEQGFDIAARPWAELSNAPLELLLELDGDMRATRVESDSVALRTPDEAGRLLVSGLFAFDAAGRDLPSRFERREGGLAIVVDDRDARYPITVDPTIVNESAKLMSAGGVYASLFGASVDIEGTWAIVGAPGTAYSAGNAYLFHQSGGAWSLQAKLTPAGLTPGAAFGDDVSITASHAVVGAPYADIVQQDAGAVYCYRNIGGVWGYSQTLLHSTPQAGGRFGDAVDIGGGYLGVGAPLQDSAYDAQSGDVEMFVISGASWIPGDDVYPPVIDPGARLGISIDVLSGTRFVVGASGSGTVYPYAHTATGGYYFTGNGYTHAGMSDLGHSVAMTNDWLFAGSPSADGSGGDIGGAVMWSYDGNWYFTEEFVTWGLSDGDRLGSSVAMKEAPGGDIHALVGVPNDDLLASNGGAVWAFNRAGAGPWLYKGAVRPAVNSDNARFGSSVAVSAYLALGGAPFADMNGELTGAVTELTYDGSSWNATETLESVDREEGDELGYAVDVEGDLAAVGAPGDSDAVLHGGAVYLFERSNGSWSQSARLTSTIDARENGRFGAALDIDPDGQSILVGAPREDGNANFSGAAYVYERSGADWVQSARLQPWSTTGLSDFGAAVAKVGELAVVGSPLADGNANSSGAVYLFREVAQSWLAEEKVELQFGSTADGFGRAVYTDGEQVVIGAPGDDGFAPEGGAVRMFEDTGAHWTLVHTVTGLTPSGGLGRAIAGEGDRLALAAPGDGSGEGRVYVVERDAQGVWSHVAQLQASDAELGDGYGEALSMDGGRVLVGAPREDVIGQQSGGAYLYEEVLGSWAETKLVQSDAAAGDLLGTSVGLSGGTALVGAPSQDEGADDAGATYVFDVPASPDGAVVSYGAGDGSNGDCPCGNNSEPGNGEGCANSSGFGGAKLSATGSTSVSADDLAFHGEQLLPNQPALLFSGEQALGGLDFGDGLRFAGVNVKRLQVSVPDAQGEADFGPGLASAGGWDAGDVRYVQIWYRDPVGGPCGSGFNLSNGLQVTFEQ